MASRVYRLLDTLDLEEGYEKRFPCPDCNSGDPDLGIKVFDGQAIWNCFRCETKGSRYLGMKAHEVKKKLGKINESKWQEDTCHKLNLMEVPPYVVYKDDSDLLNGFKTYWGLEHVQLQYDVRDKRAVFPIYDEDNRLIDAVGRSLDGSLPKWYKYTGAATLYKTCQGISNGVAVVVEDVISAHTICSVCPNVTGVALLGTVMNEEHMEYLQDYSKVIIALDRDASKKTLTYKRDVASWTGVDTIAMLLQDDIKYKEEDDKTLLMALCK